MGSFLPDNRPVLTVDAIVTRGDYFLLIKRKNPPYGWALPGGLVDAGETTETAVMRELKEETNLEAKSVKLFKVASEPNRDPRFSAISLVYEIQAYGGELKAGDDAIEFGWFSLLNIDNLNLTIAFDHLQIIKEFEKSRW